MKKRKNIMKEERAKEIIKAALDVFASKGFNDATISDIAQKAGVADGTCYEYFESKEELLFSIPLEVMQEMIDGILLHLQGIKGAINKIRKYIWFYMNFFDKNKNYASIMLLQLKQNRKFLTAPAYKLIQAYTKIFVDIVSEGVNEGVIRSDINPKLIRDMLLGLVNHVTIRWLLTGKPESIMIFFEDIATLIISAISLQQKEKKETLYFIDNKFYSYSDNPDEDERLLFKKLNTIKVET